MEILDHISENEMGLLTYVLQTRSNVSAGIIFTKTLLYYVNILGDRESLIPTRKPGF